MFAKRGIGVWAVCGVALALTVGVAPAWATTCYVNVNAAGANNGTSWGDAYESLQSALTAPACQAEDAEIWVAQGVYKPTTSLTDRNVAFNILPGMQVYGGFVGSETARDNRDPRTHVTVLSGDIDGNDVSRDHYGVTIDASNIQGANSYHVVVMGGTQLNSANAYIGSNTVLDGVTITAGLADFDDNNSGHFFVGAGLLCNGGGMDCSPTLTGLVFSGNQAGFGGAIYCYGNRGASSPTIRLSVFSGNRANSGGAIYNYGGNQGTSSPTISQSSFRGNFAQFGGAIYNNGGSGVSNPRINQSTFSGNSVSSHGGAIYNTGAEGRSSASIQQSSFSGNSAGGYGGAIFNNGNGNGAIAPTLDFVTLSGNRLTGSSGCGAAMFNLGVGAQPLLNHSILWGNTGIGGTIDEVCELGSPPTTYQDTVVQGSNASGTVNADPKLGSIEDNGGPTHTMLPSLGGSAVNLASSCLNHDGSTATADQRGLVRPQGAFCDRGAVERQHSTLQVTVIGSGMVSGGAGACASTSSSCSTNDYDAASAINVVLTANAAEGSTFTGWGGNCSGADSVCAFTMDRPRNLTATFTLKTYSISGNVSGLTSSGLALNINGVDYPVSGGSFNIPDVVTHGGSYTATIGSQPIGQICQVVRGAIGNNVTAPVTGVELNCVASTYAVTTAVLPAAEAGTLSCQPANPVTHGQTVVCTAVAAPGFSFSAFEGDCTGTDKTCTLSNVQAHKSVTARFAPVTTPVPTLAQWALMLLGLVVGGLGVRRLRAALGA